MYGGVVTQGEPDLYLHSPLAQKLEQKRFVSIVDEDGTHAAGDPSARIEARARLESLGAFVFCTARTPELVMSRRSYMLSKTIAGFCRSEPTRLNSGGVEYDNPLDTLPADEKDPDAIISFGQGLYIGGVGCQDTNCRPYFCDTAYRDKYLDSPTDRALLEGKTWYQVALELIRSLGLEEKLTHPDNVDRLDFRLQLDFRGRDAVMEKYNALARIHAATSTGPLAGRIEGVDESKPGENPDESRATLYVMVPQGRKENMINYALSRSCRSVGIATSEVSGLIIGDTLTDFYAACYAGWDANFTGIIVGGSRLWKCIEEKTHFAGVDLRRMHSALVPTDRPGFYKFLNPLTRGGWIKKEQERTLILGDRAYPGTIGAETILAYLKEFY